MSLFNSFTLTVKRTSPGYYERGRWIEGTESTIQIQTSWQPANGSDLENLEEGMRSSTIYKIYPGIQLFVADPLSGKKADIVIGPDSYEYDVISVGNYQNNIINHYKCMVIKKKEGI